MVTNAETALFASNSTFIENGLKRKRCDIKGNSSTIKSIGLVRNVSFLDFQQNISLIQPFLVKVIAKVKVRGYRNVELA